jgi:copper chaperone
MRETFSVPDVHCEHCDRAITQAVGSLEGVDSVSVDLETKNVTVGYDDARIQRERVIAAIEDEGYPVGRSSSGGLSIGFGAEPS